MALSALLFAMTTMATGEAFAHQASDPVAAQLSEELFAVDSPRPSPAGDRAAYRDGYNGIDPDTATQIEFGDSDEDGPPLPAGIVAGANQFDLADIVYDECRYRLRHETGHRAGNPLSRIHARAPPSGFRSAPHLSGQA
jgi:hypothetical protein